MSTNGAVMVLDQRAGFLSRQRFTLGEEELVCAVRGFGRSSQFAVRYEEVGPSPVGVKRVAWAWFATAGLFVGAAAALVAWRFIEPMRYGDARVPTAVFLSAASALFAFGGLKRTYNCVIFGSAAGNLVFRNGRPTAEACNAFVAELRQRIDASRDVRGRITKDVLKVLRQEELLDEWGFKKACERLELKAA